MLVVMSLYWSARWREGRITPQVIEQMHTWQHSGFSVDKGVRLAAGDTAAIRRLTQYIVRCPFSLDRIVEDCRIHRGARPARRRGAHPEPRRSRDGLPLVGSNGARLGGRNGNHCALGEDAVARGPPAAPATPNQLVLELEYADTDQFLMAL